MDADMGDVGSSYTCFIRLLEAAFVVGSLPSFPGAVLPLSVVDYTLRNVVPAR